MNGAWMHGDGLCVAVLALCGLGSISSLLRAVCERLIQRNRIANLRRET